jgi:hypothetical protein
MKKPIHKLLEEYRQKHSAIIDVDKLQFTEIIELDVYNLTAPFKHNEKDVLIARVEARDTEYSHIRFFYKSGISCFQVPDSPVFELQDPFWSVINGELVVGGVEIITDNNKIVSWRTKFYRGSSIFTLKEFFNGPMGMKDIRLCETKKGEVCVFTRPQGKKGGKGKIGFIKIPSLDDLTVEIIDSAPILDMFNDDEWGGVNQALLLENGNIGCLGHIACFSNGDIRHYYPMVFIINPEDCKYTYPKIILERSNLLPGPAKRDDLKDVIFPGGIEFENDSKVMLYLGVSDAECQICRIKNPFID